MGTIDTKERLLQFIGYQRISVHAFEINCGLSNGYVKGIRQSISRDKCEQIAKIYPQLSIPWLLTGEGEMLRPITQTANGNGNVQVAGDNNHVEAATTIDKLLNLVAQQQATIQTLTESLSRLTQKL